MAVVVGAPEPEEEAEAEADPLSTIQTLFSHLPLPLPNFSYLFLHCRVVFTTNKSVFDKRKQTRWSVFVSVSVTYIFLLSLSLWSRGSSYSYHGFLRDNRYSDSCGCSSGCCSHCCCCFLYLFLHQTQRFDLLLLAFTLF